VPRWDLTAIYPGLDATQFVDAVAALARHIDELTAWFDARGIGRGGRRAVDAKLVELFERAVAGYGAVLRDGWTLRTYVDAVSAADSRDQRAQARWSEVQQQWQRVVQLKARFTAWTGSLDIEPLVEQSAVAREHAFLLRQARIAAGHQMSPAEESLAAALRASGAAAWEQLYRQIWSQMLVEVELDGKRTPLPMSAARQLAFHPDRATRRAAYQAELDAWWRVALPLAAALNGVKGEANLLARRRGWGSPLDEACFRNGIDRQTLDALLAAARESFPDFRRYLRAKAQALGVPALAWYDLYAPVGGESREWSFAAAHELIATEFGRFSDRLRDLAERAFRERWLDLEPRDGKAGGGICLAFPDGTSRILNTFAPTFGATRSLAHELGHAYHNLLLVEAGRSPLHWDATPPVLAETASVFCEMLIHQAGVARAGEQERLGMLDAVLQNVCRFVVDVAGGFAFEQRFLSARSERELSVDEINALMLACQRETYGDALDQETLHPFMWAWRPHLFFADEPFSSFPYLFGLLFSLGLYARYRQDPEPFRANFDQLLAATSLADAATLAAHFDIDIRTPDFWRASLDVVRADIERFEALVTSDE
jgi:pepF/M3 family oligoendopeptidase